jgi:hypothetical protein
VTRFQLRTGLAVPNPQANTRLDYALLRHYSPACPWVGWTCLSADQRIQPARHLR